MRWSIPMELRSQMPIIIIISIQDLDSDGDGFTNIAEITAGTFPGDASSRPTALLLLYIGGNLSGLSSGNVVLQNNGGNNLSLSANGSFAFTTALTSGTAYSVTILTQPAGQTCSVSNGSGTIGSANVTNVSVSCAALPATTYTLGGNLSGLSSGTLCSRIMAAIILVCLQTALLSLLQP